MLYNEEEVLRICKKYGIDTIKKIGYPIYMDKEMDENFSFSEIMHRPVDTLDDDIIFSSEHISLTLPVYFDNLDFCNSYFSECKSCLIYETDEVDTTIVSSISEDNQNKYAA